MVIRTEKALLTQQEAAKQLGVTQANISHLVKTGSLEHFENGDSRRFVTADSVNRYARQSRDNRKALKSETAMGVLYLLSDMEAPWLTRMQSSRCRRRLAETDAGALVWLTRKRAKRLGYWIHDSKIEALLGEIRVSGCAIEEIADLFNLSVGIPEGYVHESDLPDIGRRFRLKQRKELKDRVILHVVPDVITLPGPGSSMPAAVCAADLAESSDPREHGEGLYAIEMMLKQRGEGQWRR